MPKLEEIERYRQFRIRNSDYETGLSHDERFIINAMRSKLIQQQDDLIRALLFSASSTTNEDVNNSTPTEIKGYHVQLDA